MRTHNIRLDNYRASDFAVFPIAVMYFYNKMAEECTPAVTSRSSIDYHNIPSLLVKRSITCYFFISSNSFFFAGLKPIYSQSLAFA